MDFVFEGREFQSPYIDSIWRTRSEGPGSFISTASTQWNMVVTRYQGKTTFTVRGPETKATPADYPADVEFFGINFKLGTFMPHFSNKTLCDRQDLNLPFATSDAIWLNNSTWQLPTFENADIFVAQLIRKGLITHEPIVDALLQGQQPHYSLRTVQYRFLHATGLTYATLRQIERAHQAAELLGQGRSILDTTHDTGYFDQAHLARSLKRYMGQTPSQLLRVG